MDTELLKTFLDLHRTRHFGHTAKNLHLTQSAVSARIRLLEQTLGVQLFTRHRNDIQLTPAGGRLVKHAESIVGTWNRAMQDAALGAEDKIPLAVGGMYSLWDILLQSWVNTLYREAPHIALAAEAHGPDVLIRKLLDGALDIAFMFEPPQIEQLAVREIGTIRLTLVATRPGLSAAQAVRQPDYVLVDWGTSFSIVHARRFPDMPPPSLRMGMGRMALAFLLADGGVAYLAEQMVAEHLAQGRLYRVADAPVIDRGVYAVYPPAGGRQSILEKALAFLPPLGAVPDREQPPYAAAPGSAG